jgi:hypothetical protein
MTYVRILTKVKKEIKKMLDKLNNRLAKLIIRQSKYKSSPIIAARNKGGDATGGNSSIPVAMSIGVTAGHV